QRSAGPAGRPGRCWPWRAAEEARPAPCVVARAARVRQAGPVTDREGRRASGADPRTTGPDAPRERAGDVERAHLLDPRDGSFTIARFPPRPDLDPVVRRFWLPVWRVPDGEQRRQQVLQYPVALLVISDDYARFYGVAQGLSETVLTGTGWACGAMLQPATGHLLSG